MGLFKPDLYRSFAIGFLIGLVAIGVHTAPDWQAEFASQAYAAELASESGVDKKVP